MGGSLPSGEGSREFCVTAGLTMWALFPPCLTSVPLRVEGREELGWSICQGPGRELCTAHPEERKMLNVPGGPPMRQLDRG